MDKKVSASPLASIYTIDIIQSIQAQLSIMVSLIDLVRFRDVQLQVCLESIPGAPRNTCGDQSILLGKVEVYVMLNQLLIGM